MSQPVPPPKATAMPAPNKEEDAKTIKFGQLPVGQQAFFLSIALLFKAGLMSIRDTVIAKSVAWLLPHLSPFEYKISAPTVFTGAHVLLFLYRQSSWKGMFAILQQYIGRDAAEEDLFWLAFISVGDAAAYVACSVFLHNLRTVWRLSVPILAPLFVPSVLFILLIDNPRQSFNALVVKAFSFVSSAILLCLGVLQPCFVLIARGAVQIYIQFAGYAASRRQLNTADLVPTLHKYKYSALEQGQIRLIKLSKQMPWNPIRCELVHVDLDQAPAFETISYTWGTVSTMKALVLNGKILEVSERVYDILNNRTSWVMTRFLWLDALCINQGDDDEKTTQVRLMRKIYRSSKHTLIWFGVIPSATDALTFLCYLRSRMRSDDAQKRAALPLTALSIEHPDLPNAWPALIDFIKNDYWRRCWIIQEIAVSKTVVLSIGGVLFPWDEFSALVEALFGSDPNSAWHISKIYSRQNSMAPLPMDAGLQLSSLVRIRGVLQQAEGPIDLFELLTSSINSTATDPRDNVYSLQGISAAADSGDVVPDYSSTIEQPFFQTAEYLLRQEHSSRIIHLAGIGFYRKGNVRTSWIPDWSSPRVSRPYWEFPGSSSYCAAGDTDDQLDQQISADGLTLFLQGFRVDQIQELGPRFFGSSENGIPKTSSTPGDLKNWADCTSMIVSRACAEPHYPTGISQVEALWRTLLGDKTSSGTRPADPIFAKYYEAMEKFVQILSRFGPHMNPLESTESMEVQIALAKEISAIQEGCGRFGVMSGPHTRERMFAITERGYMGIIPPYSQIGDVLFVIPKVQVPFLLRPLPDATGEKCGQRWQLVGECYFHGMMDGEMIQHGHSLKQNLEIY